MNERLQKHTHTAEKRLAKKTPNAYRSERKAAGDYADRVMSHEKKNGRYKRIGAWVHAWGLVYNAYLAGMRGKR